MKPPGDGPPEDMTQEKRFERINEALLRISTASRLPRSGGLTGLHQRRDQETARGGGALVILLDEEKKELFFLVPLTTTRQPS